METPPPSFFSFVVPTPLVPAKPSTSLYTKPIPNASLNGRPEHPRNGASSRKGRSNRNPRAANRLHQPCPPAPPNARLTPILSLSRSQYRDHPQDVTASPFWRVVLLSDGHLPHHLSIFTGQPLQLTHLHTTGQSPSCPLPRPAHPRNKERGRDSQPVSNPAATDMATTDVARAPQPPMGLFPQPAVRRSVCMTDPNQADGTVLYATSCWDPQSHAEIMAGRDNMPLYLVFEKLKLRVSRALTHVHYGVCPGVARAFGLPEDTLLWARDTVFRRNGQTFVSVHEILSPRMDQYLGELRPPPNVLSVIESRILRNSLEEDNDFVRTNRDIVTLSPDDRLVRREDNGASLHPDLLHRIPGEDNGVTPPEPLRQDGGRPHFSEDPRAEALGMRLPSANRTTGSL